MGRLATVIAKPALRKSLRFLIILLQLRIFRNLSSFFIRPECDPFDVADWSVPVQVQATIFAISSYLLQSSLPLQIEPESTITKPAAPYKKPSAIRSP